MHPRGVVKSRRVSLSQLALSVLLAGCAYPPSIAATVPGEAATRARPLPETRVPATRTPSEAPQEPFCLDAALWDRIWVYDLDLDGPPQALSVGPGDDYWFLHQHSAVRRAPDGDYTRYGFGEAPGCAGCSSESNGTIAIAPDGSAWIGLVNGILEVSRDGTVRFLDSAGIFPEGGGDKGPLVLVVDTAGGVWASNTMGWLCHMQGEEWLCVDLNELPSATGSQSRPDTSVGYATSGVTGRADQIWFGTSLGFVLSYQSGRYALENLQTLFPGFGAIYAIGAMAFDERSGSLWAVETAPPECGEGLLTDTIGVFSRGADGQWLGFEKSLFSTGIEDDCYGAFTSIAVTQDGRVWAGMLMRHDLVYYENEKWYSVRGEPLPSTPTVPWTLCSNVRDLAPSASGHLLVSNLDGVFEYLGTDH